MAFERLEASCTCSHLQASVEHNAATDRVLHLEYENKALEVDNATMAVRKEYNSQNAELIRVSDGPTRTIDDASRKKKRKRNRKKK